MLNGHNLEIYVYPILEKLGYAKEKIHSIIDSIDAYPNPDYIIEDDNKKIAVELGGLSRKNKINDLLEIYDKVIWIFADAKLPFLQCIVYDKNISIIEKDASVIREESEREINKLNNIINNLKNKMEELNTMHKTLSHKLSSIEYITKHGGGHYYQGEWDYDVKIKNLTDIKNKDIV